MKILVLHDAPADFEGWLRANTAGHEVHWAVEPAAVEPGLSEIRPDIIFSIKHSEFPGPCHAPTLQCPSVKWFQVGGSGFEHLGSWDPTRVTVTNSAGVLAPFHAERAMAALLYLSTGLARMVSSRRWAPSRFSTLEGKTLLVVGLGATGRELANRARAFGMKVIGVTRSGEERPEADESYPVEALPSLWSRADVLSLNVPLNTATRHLVDEGVLGLLSPDCIVLNGSRGDVVDQRALEEALSAGKLGGAWLDVTSPEPLPENSVLWTLPKVVITSHSADQVLDFPLRFARHFVENLQRYEKGEELFNVLSPPVL